MKNEIAVIGLGKAGLPLASIIANRGFEVIGVDIDERRCEAINSGKNPIPEEMGLDELIKMHGGKDLIATTKYDDAKECTVFIVIVPLFTDETNNPDFSILESAFREVGKILKKQDLVVLETSVPPKTTEERARKWLEEESGLELCDFYLAHSPERIMTGFSISRLKEFPKVVGGVNPESGVKAVEIYKNFIPNLHIVSSARVAEFIKLMEGCYRDVNIGLANELFKIADELGVDFYEAREYANHEYCHIHLPSTGVGGHCIPVYPWFLIKEMEKREKFERARLLLTAREINDEMIEYWAEKIVLECMKINKPLKEVKICVKGITFRDSVKELYQSRNLALAKLLSEKGLDVYVYDELFSSEEIDGIGLCFIEPEDADLVFDCFGLKMERRGGK
jgi:UDP-N-acetyl-D-mannosaminuronic acid dehydrogenase